MLELSGRMRVSHKSLTSSTGTGSSPGLVAMLAPLFLTWVLVGVGSDAASSSTTAFVGVHVVPMDSERVLPNQTVIIADGRIAGLGPVGRTAIPVGAHRIDDAAGKFLMPGLADMHVHIGTERDLTLLVANGVTTVRNMWGFDWLLDWRREQIEGRRFTPTIYTAGPLLDGDPPIWLRSAVVTDPERAKSIVRMQKRDGFDFVKVYVRLSREVYDALIETAREVDIPVVGHVPYAVGLDHVLASGQASIEHLDGYMEALQTEDSPYRAGPSEVDRRFYSTLYVDFAKIPEVVARTKRAEVWNCPTLIVEKKWTTRERAARFFYGREMGFVPGPTLDWWRGHNGLNLSQKNAEVARKSYEVRKKLVKALYDAGAGLLLGTDTPNPLVVAGFSVHEELVNLVEAGLPAFAALAAGTRDAARFLGEEGEFGTVTVGSRADLLLVDGNPLEDIRNASKIRGVMVRGRYHDASELEGYLSELRTTVGGRRAARGRGR